MIMELRRAKEMEDEEKEYIIFQHQVKLAMNYVC